MVTLPSKATVLRPQSLGYDAAIGDLLVRLSVTPDTRLDKAVAPPAASRVNLADEAEEFVTEEPTFAVRDVTGGEGLFYTHRPTDSERDARRFWASRGIDTAPTLPGEAAGFRLLKDTELAVADTATNLHMTALPDGSVLFSDGAAVNRVTTINATPSTSAEDPHTGTQAVTGLVTIGDLAFAACGTDGAATRSAAGTWSDLASAPTADGGVSGLWTAKGRLFGTITNGRVFAELNTTTGATTTLLTLPSGTTVTDVCDAGTAILVSATDGVVYAFVLEEDSTLVLAGQTKFGDNEYPTTLAHGFGVVAVGTAQRTGSGGVYGRLYIGTLNVDTFRDLQLYRVFDRSAPASDRAPHAAITYRDSIYVAVPDADSKTTVWRYHLGTGALTEHFRFGASAVPKDMLVVGERLILGLPGTGVYRESANYVTSGYLISSAADFFTARSKEWVFMRANGLSVSAGASVAVEVTNDVDALTDPTHVSWRPIVTIYSDEQWDALFALAAVEASRYVAIKVTIRPTTARTGTPIVASVTVFASLLPDEILVRLPVNVSDRVERTNRQPINVPGLGAAIERRLLGMQGTAQNLELYRYPLSLTGVVVDVETTTPQLGDRGSGSLLAMVTFRGRFVDSEAGGALTGESSLGMGTLGLHTMGL